MKCSETGHAESSQQGETNHEPAGLVELINLEAMAEVPGEVSEAVEEVEGDGEGEEELEGEDDRPSQLERLELGQS